MAEGPEDSQEGEMKHETLPAVVVKLMVGRERAARGLCQGRFRRRRPESLGGDLNCPRTAVDEDPNALSYLSAALPPGHSIISYVDAPGRTLAEILALFDRAIEGALR